MIPRVSVPNLVAIQYMALTRHTMYATYGSQIPYIETKDC